MAIPTPIFSPATPADRDRLLPMMQDFYAAQLLSFTPAVIAAAANLLATPTLGHISLIRDGGEIVGYLVLTFGYSLERAGLTALLDELYVLPSHRNRGYGTAALHHAIASTTAAHCLSLHIEVDHANTAAHALYARLG